MKHLLLVFLCFTTAWTAPKTLRKGRIIGGTEATGNQFPFSAAIRYRTTNGQYFCGGTLISNIWVLSAARCVDGVSQFTVSLGSTQFTAADNNRIEVATSEYTIHPEYDADGFLNDIGLIEFRFPIIFNDLVRPVDFLASDDLLEGTAVVTIGWGQTSDIDPSFASRLQWVYVTTISNEECQIFYDVTVVHDETVCVNGNYNEGTCLGDIGSPLIHYIGGGHTVVVGISSFISSNGCESTDPSGFVRTAPYRDFIRNVTGV